MSNEEVISNIQQRERICAYNVENSILSSFSFRQIKNEGI